MCFKFVFIEINYVKKLKKIFYNLKDYIEEIVYGMLLDFVKCKVEEWISKFIFYKIVLIMNLIRFFIFNFINVMLYNLLWLYNVF